ncbi:hypothetical protein CK218_07560 [Mesorhizobium sp. WSM3879]|uniref:hypothetical protein n=1 Tax=Mesorhizobium sp. WSM3879 TaxID=2029406 RepID=UPI000BB05401|nr:hypothetical protein [Mesorhizobium sp. WSM3879]PBB81514.1 hypothetical protein CK218_07560 [Mesorhizobium sp. WSM3879]
MSELVSFKGWVPTVNGRLSYKIIGESRHPTIADYANVATPEYQFVLAIQSRNTTDVLFHWLLAKFFQVSGDFTFVFCARARRGSKSPDDPLIGRVYVVRPGSDSSIQLKEKMPNWLHSLRGAELGVGKAELCNLFGSLHRELTSICDFRANVILHRNGIISISKIAYSDDEIYQNTLRYANNDHVEIDSMWADQIYYFVRDISHQHQHHSPDADTMITTYRVRGRSMEWSNRVIYSLYFYIINSKRRLEPTEQVRVLGVLAYLNSFKQIATEQAATSKLPLQMPVFNDQATKDSINATKSYLDLKFSEKKQNSDKYRTVLFTIAATLLTLVNFVSGFADPEVTPAKWVGALADFVKVNAYICLAPPAIILVWWLSDVFLVPNYEAKRDAVRLGFANRRVFAAVTIPIALLILYAAWRVNIIATVSLLHNAADGDGSMPRFRCPDIRA